MCKFIRISIILTLIFCACSCSSMTPLQVHNTLPSLTKSKYITQAQATDAVSSTDCKYLFKGRTYMAPIGFTPKNDLQNGAKGIDEWVQIDGGNAYVLTNFRWISIDNSGSTQLYIEFDTLSCK